MAKLVLDQASLGLIGHFEKISGARVKDCISGDPITFVVEKGQMGLAIGKEGRTLRKLEQGLRKSVRLIEHDEDVLQFIRNAVKPLHRFELRQEENRIIIKGEDTKTKGLLIGRDRANLNRLLSLVKRYFDIEGISVV